MKYAGEQSNPKSGRSMKLIGRVATLILLIVGGILLFQYRSNLSTRISKVVAASEDEPIPVTKLSRQPFSLSVPSTGEIVGLETTACGDTKHFLRQFENCLAYCRGELCASGRSGDSFRQHRCKIEP